MSSQPFTNNEVAQYGQVKVETDVRANVAAVRKQIAGLGLTTASPLDTLDQINTIFTIFTFVVAGFGGIGMVIAVLGMFNTLTISLLERTSELGLMITWVPGKPISKGYLSLSRYYYRDWRTLGYSLPGLSVKALTSA